MSKLKVWRDQERRFIGVDFVCPGCGDRHMLPLRQTLRGFAHSSAYDGSPHWDWNNDLSAPTLSPSILVRSGHHTRSGGRPGDCYCDFRERYPDEPEPPFSCYVCHSFVRDGRIQFLPDCTHSLAGQTVDLPEIEE